MPVVPVEATIALSILFLAREIAVGRPQSLANRYPLLVSSSFGLLHGLGFASALSEIGLVSGELLTSLFSFNLGVEVGQILVILPILLVAWLAGRSSVAHRFPALGRFRPALPTVLLIRDRRSGVVLVPGAGDRIHPVDHSANESTSLDSRLKGMYHG